MPSLSRRAAVLCLAAPLAGCGFALRKPPRYAFRSIDLSLPVNSTLRPVLTRALQAQPALQVLSESQDRQTADVVLEVLSEIREKVATGQNAVGQAREFVLRLKLRFRLHTPRGLELLGLTELIAEREISFAEQAALAKEEEEALLYRDMRKDLLRQLLARLAAVPDLVTPAPTTKR